MAFNLSELIQKAKVYTPSARSFTGDEADRIRALFTLVKNNLKSGVISVQPGDYVRTPSSEYDPGISIAAPIGYDIWYLFHFDNILKFETAEEEARTNEILERLDPFLSALQDVKPLKTLRNINDLKHVTWWSWAPAMNYWQNNAPYMIKEMRYETILEGKSFKYDSKNKESGSVGFLAFPIGQLGVMEIVSLVGESMTEDDTFSIDAREAIKEGGEMMPPVHHNRGYCIGTHLVEEGYRLQDYTEYPADEFIGFRPAAPHFWLRYWIMPDDTFPVPGEFVALLAKPELYHVWWMQLSYPFLYSGSFFETEYYSSGIIQEIIEPDEDSEEETNIYRIHIRCYEMWLRPSDFAEYLVGDRVAVLKETLELVDNMDWAQLESFKDNDSSTADSPDEDWKIVPISFYK